MRQGGTDEREARRDGGGGVGGRHRDGRVGHRVDPGRHPHIASAQKSLAAAEKQLMEAVHHYGGHRARALELTQQVRAELREALEYARTHAGEFK